MKLYAAGFLVALAFVACRRDDGESTVPPSSGEASPAVPSRTVKPIYTPDPPYERLAETAAAKEGKPIPVGISFCMDSSTGQVRTAEVTKSSGDADVDAIVLATIETWRFERLEDGDPTDICSKVFYKVRFTP